MSLRARGLKYCEFIWSCNFVVVPLVGTWIEMIHRFSVPGGRGVVPLVGTQIIFIPFIPTQTFHEIDGHPKMSMSASSPESNIEDISTAGRSAPESWPRTPNQKKEREY